MIGASSLMSRLYVKDNNAAEVSKCFYTAAVLSFLGGLLTAAVVYLSRYLVFDFFTVPEAVRPNLDSYLFYIILSFPFQSLMITISGAIRGTGKTLLTTLLISIFALSNIFLDYVFLEIIGGSYRDLASIGLATFISSVLVYFAGAFVAYYCFGEALLKPKVSWKVFRKLARVAVPAAATNIVSPIGEIIITAVISAIAVEYIAAYGVASRLALFLSIPLLALSAGVSPYSGQNFSAGRLDKIREAASFLSWASLIYTLILSFIVFLFSHSMFSLFSKDLGGSESFAFYYLFSYTVGGVFFGIFIGINSILNATDLAFYAFKASLYRVLLATLPLCLLAFVSVQIEWVYTVQGFSSLVGLLFSLYFLKHRLLKAA